MQIREDLQKVQMTEHSNIGVALGDSVECENSTTTTTGGNITRTSSGNSG